MGIHFHDNDLISLPSIRVHAAYISTKPTDSNSAVPYLVEDLHSYPTILHLLPGFCLKGR